MKFIDYLRNTEESIKKKLISVTEEIKVSSDVRENRINLCHECEYFIKASSQCKNCGCFMPMKTWLKSAKCPVNKWN